MLCRRNRPRRAGIVLERLLLAPHGGRQRSGSGREASAQPRKPPLSGPRKGRRRPSIMEAAVRIRATKRGEWTAPFPCFSRVKAGCCGIRPSALPSRNNRPLSEPKCAEPLSRVQRDEQVAYDRLARAARRIHPETVRGRKIGWNQSSGSLRPPNPGDWGIEKPWSRLEQALKATDLFFRPEASQPSCSIWAMCFLSTRCVSRWGRGIAFGSRQSKHALRLSCSLSPHAPAVARHSPSLRTGQRHTLQQPWRNALFERQQYTLMRERNRNESSACSRRSQPHEPSGAPKLYGRGCGDVCRSPSSELRSTGRALTSARNCGSDRCVARWRATAETVFAANKAAALGVESA